MKELFQPDRAFTGTGAKIAAGVIALLFSALFLFSAQSIDRAASAVNEADASGELGGATALYGFYNDILRFAGLSLVGGGLAGIGAGLFDIYRRRNT